MIALQEHLLPGAAAPVAGPLGVLALDGDDLFRFLAVVVLLLAPAWKSIVEARKQALERRRRAPGRDRDERATQREGLNRWEELMRGEGETAAEERPAPRPRPDRAGADAGGAPPAAPPRPTPTPTPRPEAPLAPAGGIERLAGEGAGSPAGRAGGRVGEGAIGSGFDVATDGERLPPAASGRLAPQPSRLGGLGRGVTSLPRLAARPPAPRERAAWRAPAGPEQWRRALVWSTVLGPPVALRTPEGDPAGPPALR